MRRHGRGPARRVVLPLVVVLALVGLVLTITVGTYRTRAASAPQDPPVFTLPPPPAAPQPLSLPDRPRVLIIGDSYTEGWGAEPTTRGFAYQVAKPLGWRLTRDGIGSTGYTARGYKQQGTYRERLAEQPGKAFDLVILQGGSNDEDVRLDRLEKAVAGTVEAVQAKYPTAQVLVMGPVAPYGAPSPARASVNALLTRYCRDHAVLFMNPVSEHWFVQGDAATLVNQAKGHPNNAGYRRIADLFVQDIRRLSAAAEG